MLVSAFLGMLINTFIRMTISVLSFWIEDSMPFHWIYDKLILVVGMLFPIEMFPIWLQPAIRFSPIYVVTYGPAKLIIDFNQAVFIRVVMVQLIYFTVTLLILLGLFQRGVKKLNVNGG
jgi:ABC-2 type transport system permease protein